MADTKREGVERRVGACGGGVWLVEALRSSVRASTSLLRSACLLGCASSRLSAACMQAPQSS
eukprot:3550626-Rhodomonas_salina.1